MCLVLPYVFGSSHIYFCCEARNPLLRVDLKGTPKETQPAYTGVAQFLTQTETAWNFLEHFLISQHEFHGPPERDQGGLCGDPRGGNRKLDPI